jgi:riboflavin biosynthesis pyrimidine reductase
MTLRLVTPDIGRPIYRAVTTLDALALIEEPPPRCGERFEVFAKVGQFPNAAERGLPPPGRPFVQLPGLLCTRHRREVYRLAASDRLAKLLAVQVNMHEAKTRLFSALLQEDLVDELFLSLAPKLTGGGNAPAITSGPALVELRALSLVWALERDSSLYLRYALRW